MSPTGKGISAAEARRFYDRYGAKQDDIRHEDEARSELQRLSVFEHACNVFELGCGTGSFARKLFDESFPTTTRYLGVDVSSTMIDLAQDKLEELRPRARVVQTDGELEFNEPDGFYDRFVACYVFDLLPEEKIREGAAEAHRLLAKEGRLCLVSLTRGGGNPVARTVSALWSGLQRIGPNAVGGCRPIDMTRYLPKSQWDVKYADVITSHGVPSQITIAVPKK